MSTPTNEFSDLDRTVASPDGTTYEFVVHVGYGMGGWGLFWGRGKEAHDPVITVYARGEQVHQEPAADRKDAQRILSRLEGQVRAGML